MNKLLRVFIINVALISDVFASGIIGANPPLLSAGDTSSIAGSTKTRAELLGVTYPSYFATHERSRFEFKTRNPSSGSWAWFWAWRERENKYTYQLIAFNPNRSSNRYVYTQDIPYSLTYANDIMYFDGAGNSRARKYGQSVNYWGTPIQWTNHWINSQPNGGVRNIRHYVYDGFSGMSEIRTKGLAAD